MLVLLGPLKDLLGQWLKRPFPAITHQYIVLKSILVEFQEAQCFFMLASEIAVLILIRNGPIVFGAKSLMQLHWNFALVGLVSGTGSLPIACILFALTACDMVSWYIISLSGVTISTATATMAIYNNLVSGTFDRSLQPVNGVELLTECGGNPPPIVYCGQSLEGPSDGSPTVQIQFSWFILAMCVLRHALRSMPESCLRITSTWLETITKYLNFRHIRFLWIPFRTARRRRIWYGLVVFILGLFILLAMGLNLQTLQDLSAAGAIDTTNWTLGQIISVTIWAPVLCKYGYASICE